MDVKYQGFSYILLVCLKLYFILTRFLSIIVGLFEFYENRNQDLPTDFNTIINRTHRMWR